MPAVTTQEIQAEIAKRRGVRVTAGDVQAEISRRAGSQEASTARGAANAFAQGATLGFADEIQGGIASLVAAADRAMTPEGPIPQQPRSIADDYKQASGEIRADDERFAKENPLTSVGLNVAGGLLTGKASLGALKAVGVPVTGIGGVTSSGASIGAVAGAGTAKPGETLKGAAKGAAFGAGAGLTISGVGAMIGAASRALAPGVENRFRRLAEASGMTPTQIATRLKAFGPKATLADVDDVFLRAGDVAAGRLGPNARRVQQLIRRDEGQMSRLMEPIKRMLGGSSMAAKTVDELKNIRIAEASPLYERAFNRGVKMTNRMRDLLSRPETQKAWRAVQNIGKSDPDIDVSMLADGADPSFRGWQAITERLWDRASSLDRSGQNKFSGTISNLRRAILAELDDQSDDFAKARALWAGTKQADDALDAGFAVLKPSVSAADLKAQIKKMSDGERAFFRLGVGRAVEEKLATQTDTNDLTRTFRNQAFRDKIFAVFDDNKSATDFLNTVKAEARKKATTTAVGRGSQTQPRQVAEGQLGGGNIGTEDMTKAGVINRTLKAVSGPREKTIQGIGDLVLSQDPADQARALDILRRNAAPQNLLDLSPLGAAGANLAGQR